ncbi:hypothetical protein V8F33_005062 [Rhypophila sp. PSN 637]
MGESRDFGFGGSPQDGPCPEKTDFQQEEHQFFDDAEEPVAPEGRPSLYDSIGVARLLILCLGTAAIITATALLALLWHGAAIAIGLDDPGETWRYIVDRRWAPILVTVSAAAIRTAMSLQAGVAMSMAASVLLERRQVKLGDSVFLSIIRAVSIQPVGLLFAGSRGVLKSLGLFGLPILVVTGLIAIASTFTSSILLGDFGNMNIIDDSKTSMIAWGIDSVWAEMDVWGSPPAEFARFAEYTDGSGRITDHQHIDDTGLTLRVPLPIAVKSQRETLHEYDGPATVFDHRVVCIAPKALTIQSFNDTKRTSLSFAGYATFDTDMPLPIRMGTGPEVQIPFQCLVPDADPTPGLPSNITVCVVAPASSDPPRLEPFLPLNWELAAYERPIFFIFNVTASTRTWAWSQFYSEIFRDPMDLSRFVIPRSSLVMMREGPWAITTIKGVEFLDGASFSASACITTPEGFPFNVSLKTRSDALEPALTWKSTHWTNVSEVMSWEEYGYDTSDVLHQLNVLAAGQPAALSLQQRGIMELDFATTNWSEPIYHLTDPGLNYMFNLNPTELFPTFRILPCKEQVDCITDPSAVLSFAPGGHPAHMALFHDALAGTMGTPARALQSWLTTLTRQRYYDALGRFSEAAGARYVNSVEVFVPRQWGGFLGVMAMLVCHVLAVAGVTAWYLCVTRYTMMGNSWQVVSQVVSEETLPLMRRASGLKDLEVQRIIRQEKDKSDTRYIIAKSRKTRRSELVAMSWKQKTVEDRKGT